MRAGEATFCRLINFEFVENIELKISIEENLKKF